MRFVKPPYFRCLKRFAVNFQTKGYCLFLPVGLSKDLQGSLVEM